VDLGSLQPKGSRRADGTQQNAGRMSIRNSHRIHTSAATTGMTITFRATADTTTRDWRTERRIASDVVAMPISIVVANTVTATRNSNARRMPAGTKSR
jgi:hypothetical protein